MKSIVFEIVDSRPTKNLVGKDMPPNHVYEAFNLAEFETLIRDKLRNADENVIDKASIRVLYTYPLGTTGPSTQERQLGGSGFLTNKLRTRHILLVLI